MKKFVFLVIFATAILKDVHSYPVESAVDIIVPVKVESDPVVPAKSETENVAPIIPKGDALDSATHPVAPAKAETDPVKPVKAETEPVAPVKSETEQVAPLKSETEQVAPIKSETKPVVPAKSETAVDTPAKSVTEPVSPTKSEAEPVAPVKSEVEPLAPAKSEIESVKPTKSEVEPESPAKLKVEPANPTKAEVVQEKPVVATVDVTPEVNFIVPDIPNSFEKSEYGTSRFGHIWSNRLFQFHKAGGILRDSAERTALPKTILVATEILLINLVPQDAPHPLYSSEYSTLTDTFLLDFMSSEAIDLDDKKLLTAEGAIIKTRTGKDLVFKKDAKTNVLTVNGIVITKFDKLSGDPQITVVNIDGIPFDYSNIVDTAFHELSKKSSTYGLEGTPPKVSAVESVESGVVDEVPKEVVKVESSPSQPLLSAEAKPKAETPSVKV